MSNVPATTKKILYCIFCGKSQHEVKKLIAGPNVFICNECVVLCMDIINEEDEIKRQAEIKKALEFLEREGVLPPRRTSLEKFELFIAGKPL